MPFLRPPFYKLALVAAALLVPASLALARGNPPAPPPRRASAPRAECAPQPVQPLGNAFFTDISAPSGIQDGNFVPAPATPVAANDHSRLAFVDLNGDGYDDIVTSNMSSDIAVKPFEHLIYFNNHDGTFANASDESGLRTVQTAFLAFGDVDNDGDQDAFGGVDGGAEGPRGVPNQLLLNDGAGHFTRKTDSGLEKVTADEPLAGNAVFADFDADGALDLFVGNGATSYAAPDQLYIGSGDGTFVEESSRLQDAVTRPSNGSVACDYDNDNDLDIFVSVYGVSWEHGHNVLWENDGAGHFSNVARARGFEALATGNYFLSETGNGTAKEPVLASAYVGGNGFGLSCEDVNADGLLDIWLANISHPVAGDYNRKWSDPSELLINQGPRGGYGFKNMYLEAELPFNEGDLEASVADFDNDGLPDLAVSRESKYEGNFLGAQQKAWFGLFHQNADGTFQSVGLTSGINDVQDRAAPPRLKGGHSNVWADIEHDGDLDLLVGGLDKGAGRPNFLFRNEIGAQNAWLEVRLAAPTPDADGHLPFNRDGIGARVELAYPGQTLMRELKSSRGMYNSSDTRTLHFGLGARGCAATLKVTWPNGEAFAFPGDAIGQNREVTIRYGEGEAVRVVPALLPSLVNQRPPTRP